jgi:copper/silver efflux system protein
MSLGGIAIAIGAMVDAAIVMIENAHKRLERAAPDKTRSEVIIDAAVQVGPALFFSLLIITVSFLPIFTLEDAGGPPFQAARLHQDLRHGSSGIHRLRS